MVASQAVVGLQAPASRTSRLAGPTRGIAAVSRISGKPIPSFFSGFKCSSLAAGVSSLRKPAASTASGRAAAIVVQANGALLPPPEPVMSVTVTFRSSEDASKGSKALKLFQEEDPTFRASVDPESGETIVSCMSEAQLETYAWRMRREHGTVLEVGTPRVHYKEAITMRADFNYLYKKRSGGQGLYARVCGYIEPLPEDHPTKFEFSNAIVGDAIPANYIPACEKGFRRAINAGELTGCPVEGVRVELTDGATHTEDSTALAFELASMQAFRTAYEAADATVLEPIMAVDVTVLSQYQNAVGNLLKSRRGYVDSSELLEEGLRGVIRGYVPLGKMFGFKNRLREVTLGEVEYTTEYSHYAAVPGSLERGPLAEMIADYRGSKMS